MIPSPSLGCSWPAITAPNSFTWLQATRPLPTAYKMSPLSTLRLLHLVNQNELCTGKPHLKQVRALEPVIGACAYHKTRRRQPISAQYGASPEFVIRNDDLGLTRLLKGVSAATTRKFGCSVILRQNPSRAC